MKGKILNFKAEKGFGFILGEDNQKYFFHISNVSNPMDIQENYMVEFKSKKREKGLNAINVTVQAPLSQGRSKDKILKLRNLRIRASDIKEYNVYKKLKDGSYKDADGNYKYTLTDELTKYLKYIGIDKLRYDKQDNISYIFIFWVEGFKIDNNPWKQVSEKVLINKCNNIHYKMDNYDYKLISIDTKHEDCINWKCHERYCYTLSIKTYTSGTKELTFRSHDGNKNKKDAYRMVDYIDDELNKLL